MTRRQHNRELATIGLLIGLCAVTLASAWVWACHPAAVPIPRTSLECSVYGQQAARLAQQRIAQFGPQWRDDDAEIQRMVGRDISNWRGLIFFVSQTNVSPRLAARIAVKICEEHGIQH